MLQLLLQHGADASSALPIAASKVLPSVILLLCESSAADVDASSSALHIAVKAGRASIVQILCGQGYADPLRPDKKGRPPIIRATMKGYPDVLQVLVTEGARVACNNARDGHSPEEFRASLIGAWKILPRVRDSMIVPIAATLLDAGVDPNTPVGDRGQNLLQALAPLSIRDLRGLLRSKGWQE